MFTISILSIINKFVQSITLHFRVKREAQQKHISLAVQERQKLRDILDRRKEEVRDAHKVLQLQLGEERTKV